MVELRCEKETFFNGVTPLVEEQGGWLEETPSSITFTEQIKKHCAHVRPYAYADFHQQLTVSIYSHFVPHFQAWGHQNLYNRKQLRSENTWSFVYYTPQYRCIEGASDVTEKILQ